jgi:acyl-CoA:acyl-CoA alkyltransferase
MSRQRPTHQQVRHKSAAIASLSVIDGTDVVTSADIEERLRPMSERFGLVPGMLMELTGIQERRFFPAGTLPSDVAARAGKAALNDAGLDVADVDLLISASVSQDHVEPSTASAVHGKLGLPVSALNFDIKNACLGFLTAMDVAATLIDAGRIGTALIVAGEISRDIVDATVARLLEASSTLSMYREQFVSLTLGSSACAVVLTTSDVAGSHRLIRSYNVAAGEHHHLCIGEMHEMKVDAKALTLAGLILGQQGLVAARAAFGLSDFTYPVYVMHQTSKPHLEKFCDLIDVDAGLFERTYPRYGNVGACGLPLTLHHAVKNGRVKTGQRVPLLGVGSGMNAAWLEIEW